MYHIMESQHHELVSMISYPGIGWGLDFSRGDYLDPSFGGGEILIEFERDHASLPDYFEVDGTPIVSEKFAQLWQTLAIENYQLFPITAKFPSREIQGHQVLNVVGRVACIDINLSVCNLYEGIVMRVKNLVLKQDLKQDLDLFRAQEYRLAIVISDRIRNRLQSSSVSGLLIKPADGWSDQHRF